MAKVFLSSEATDIVYSAFFLSAYQIYYFPLSLSLSCSLSLSLYLFISFSLDFFNDDMV